MYFLKIEWFFNWTNLVLITRGCIVPGLVEISPVVLEKIFKFSLFPNYIPFGKGQGPFE